MAITRGFGMTLDIERGLMRQWVVGRDGVKRWADNNRPVDEQAPHEILQAAIDTANVYASCPHEDLRLVTLRMDDALRVLAALEPNGDFSRPSERSE